MVTVLTIYDQTIASALCYIGGTNDIDLEYIYMTLTLYYLLMYSG